VKCKKCQEEIVNIEYFYTKKHKIVKCPKCKYKNKELRYRENSNYIKLGNGQIMRKSPKIRMSKKQRLKLRQEKLKK
jgi:hypothetical protein